MKRNSKNSFRELADFFSSPPTSDEKAWGIIHDFYHLILTYMANKRITRADLARRLGKSRSAISQMFNKTPNLSIKKMIEIADAIGLDINITSRQVKHFHSIRESFEFEIYQPINSQPLSKPTNILISKDSDIERKINLTKLYVPHDELELFH